MVTQFTPLVPPDLDPRNEEALVEYALDRVFTASGGRLNDFSASSPARALIEGQAFAGAELLYYLNQLPEAMAIAFLQIAGIQQRLGTQATITLEFTLTTPLAAPFTVPQGFECKADSGAIFLTSQVLTIPAGSTSGTVAAVSQEVGADQNVVAFSVRTFVQPLAFLAAVINPAAAAGGSDAETLDETKARAFAAIRRRGLVTRDDYIQEIQSILGVGSVGWAIGNLGADKQSYRSGTVHCFALNADGSLLNTAQLVSLQTTLQQKTHISINCICSNVDVYDCEAFVVGKAIAGTNPQEIADEIWAQLKTYLTPGKLPLGEAIVLKELEYVARSVGLEYLQSLSIGPHLGTRTTTNLVLPEQYSAAKLVSLQIDLVQNLQTYTYAYGIGDPD